MDAKDYLSLNIYVASNLSELVQLKLDIETLVGDSTPTKVGNGTPTYRSGSLEIG
jgi:hypothetical protein